MFITLLILMFYSLLFQMS